MKEIIKDLNKAFENKVRLGIMSALVVNEYLNFTTLKDLLAEVGRTYVPALLANAAAIDAGADEVRTEIDGRPWVQKPFPYQARCLQWLRQAYVGLEGEDRELVDTLLDGTGCEALFTRP